MKTPPFLLGAALVFWGWSSEWLLLSVLMAAMLEGSRFLRVRWDLSFTDFTRIADVTAVILAGLIVYLFVNEGILDMGFIVLRWLPAIFFLLIVTQLYSTQECFDIRSLFWSLRRRQPGYYTPETTYINLSYPYVVVCLLSAGSANVRSQTFYLLVILFAVWALWSIRNAHYPVLLWIAVLLLAVYIGYAGQRALTRLQYALETSNALVSLITGMQAPEVDPYEATTAIGTVGRIKLGNQVVFRVKSEDRTHGPILLREATYNVYQSSRWFAAQDSFVGLEPEIDRLAWILLPEEILRAEDAPDRPDYQPALPDTPKRLIVSSRLEDGKGILKLPTDTVRIDNLIAAFVRQNRFGVVKVEEGPSILTYHPVFGSGDAIDSPPDAVRDVELPEDAEAALREMVAQQYLKGATDGETVQAVADFFRQSFAYSLTLRRSRGQTPILDFLQNTRSGHCEYFATATVLLLRAAGVPARYAVGYSVDSVAADRWTFVRGREAHAWTLAYVDGAWQNFDTTPPSWRPIEKQKISPFEWFSNVWAAIEFTLAEWLQRGYITRFFLIVGILLIPVAAIRIWRWYRKKRKIRRPQPEETAHADDVPLPGNDSAFLAVIERLQQVGIPRHDWESLSHWIQRLDRHLPSQTAAALVPLLRLHYRARFDPVGLSPEEQAAFQTSVHDWLRQLSQAPRQNPNMP